MTLLSSRTGKLGFGAVLKGLRSFQVNGTQDCFVTVIKKHCVKNSNCHVKNYYFLKLSSFKFSLDGVFGLEWSKPCRHFTIREVKEHIRPFNRSKHCGQKATVAGKRLRQDEQTSPGWQGASARPAARFTSVHNTSRSPSNRSLGQRLPL